MIRPTLLLIALLAACGTAPPESAPVDQEPLDQGALDQEPVNPGSAAADLEANSNSENQDENQGKVRRLEIHFKGLGTISASDFRGVSVDEESDLIKNGYRKAEVDDMAFQMEAYAISIGYPFARVRWEYEIKGRTLHATFKVNEGTRTTLANISFTGNTRFSAEELTPFLFPSSHSKDQGEPAFVESKVMGSAGSIAALYRGLGYKNVKVETPEFTFRENQTQADVSITIHEGTCFIIHTLEWEGNSAFEDQELQRSVHYLANTPYFPRRRFEFKKALEGYYSDRGYPSAKVVVKESFDAETGEVAFRASISEGPLSTYFNVRVDGNERTNTSFILNRLALKQGQQTSKKLEDDSFRSLFRTGLFKQVEMKLAEPGPQDPSLRELQISVAEGLNREFTIEPGYGSYEMLRLMLGWRNRNIFGTGRILRAETRASMKSLQALVGITDPWLFESNVELDAPVFYRRREEPSFNREETGLALQFRYPFSPRFSLLWGYRVTQSNVSSESAALPSDILIGDTTLASVFIGPRFDTRNDYFNPTKGAKHGLQLEYGGSELASDIEFVGASLNLAQYIPIDDQSHHILALGARTAFVMPVGDTTSIPLQMRLFNGGENSARGFGESQLGPMDSLGEPIGGETSTTVNLELRQNIASSFWSALFFDWGNVGREMENYTDDFRPSYGAGIRFLLPVGALRLDYGYNPTRRPGEDQYVIHFSIGMAF